MTRRHRQAAALLAASTALVTVAGCAADKSDHWAGRGSSVSDAHEPAPSPPADLSVQGLGGLRHALQDRVIAAAGMIRPVTSSCDTASIQPAFTCRVLYQGQTVTYRVTTEEKSTDNYTWDARPDRLVATKGGVQAAMWRAYATRATAMSCDTGFPDQQLVPPGTTLRQRCYFKPTGADPAFGRTSHNNDRTVAVAITINDGKLSLHEITQ